MTRGGVCCGLPPHGTPLTSVDVAPVDSGPQEFSGAVQSLVAHVVVAHVVIIIIRRKSIVVLYLVTSTALVNPRHVSVFDTVTQTRYPSVVSSVISRNRKTFSHHSNLPRHYQYKQYTFKEFVYHVITRMPGG